MSVAEPTVVLRPQLGRRMILFGCGIVVTVIGIGALTSGALIGIGALRLVGWMLHQPTPARTRPFGHKVDGHLPEVYDGFDEVLGLMLRRADAGSSRLEAF